MDIRVRVLKSSRIRWECCYDCWAWLGEQQQRAFNTRLGGGATTASCDLAARMNVDGSMNVESVNLLFT